MSDQHRYWSDIYIWHYKIAGREATCRFMIFRCGVVMWGNVCRYACVWSVQLSEIIVAPQRSQYLWNQIDRAEVALQKWLWVWFRLYCKRQKLGVEA